METEVKLPKISDDAESGQVSEILVSEGDTIEKEQSIIVVESDKAAVEVPTTNAGTVKAIKVKENQEIKAGDVILVLEDNENGKDKGEDEQESKKNKGEYEDSEQNENTDIENEKIKADGEGEKEGKTKEKEEEEKKEDIKQQKSDDEEEKTASDKKEKSGSSEKSDSSSNDMGRPAAPLAKKLARQLGIDIKDVPVGPDNRITHDAVIDYVSQLVKKVSDKSTDISTAIQLPDFSKWGETERQPLSAIRKSIAKNTKLSWQHIPHVTQFDRADISNLQNFLTKENEKAKTKITISAVIIKVISNALVKFPKFNASLDLDKGEVIYKKYYNIGMAVDTDKGLLMPVLKHVDTKGINEIAEELKTLAEKARNRKLAPEAMQGGNFTISNQGSIGGTAFTPVIFPPQVAILGISRTEKRPVFIEGKFEPRDSVPLALSYDHRAIDGAEATRFLSWVCQVLENPMKLMMDQ